ncbi:hypothetical protein COK19_09500 [Bacillus cereus]|uniref:hypothetical protein n=1 Tax=Bacillus cereus TaxID=1396 RepID=UPI000BF4DEBA|nr:hypothetical protein [Bacillus cereus]PFR27882.1 hypothetical protein COK19_09500 [Bacillus cereus]
MSAYTIKDIQNLKIIFGEDFDPYNKSNSQSDFANITIPLLAKGLANYLKKYYRYANYPAEFTGAVSDLRHFVKDAKLDIYKLYNIFEYQNTLEELTNELKKNNINLTYIGGRIKLVEI